LNRLDEMVVFRQLGRDQVRKIVDIQLQRFQKRLKERELNLQITDAAKDLLGNLGYDPTYGARPLKRVIQRHLENPVASELLAGNYQPGDSVFVDAQNGELKIVRRAAGAAETAAA
jgi:ATP-dependent Clp protease ATP-binding subunit ClpB